ncbi:antitoxin [Allosalinactinospora lopnorensis]|uniref:antitoxin n=1 Tax=Allosalinactinospora lopnorensis TaxID=1352348 RepID=UPI000623E204|nr:antitoxin [Allosalinactinospora lopnorensis]
MSGLGDAFNKVKRTAEKNSEKIAEQVEKVAKTAKRKTGSEHDDKIDKASGTATEYLRKRAEKERTERDEQ